MVRGALMVDAKLLDIWTVTVFEVPLKPYSDFFPRAIVFRSSRKAHQRAKEFMGGYDYTRSKKNGEYLYVTDGYSCKRFVKVVKTKAF